MEWSDPDDAWGDERADERAAGSAYPPAPVPAHERAWRHPSEVGHHANQAWAIAEPPVALGRGLLVATSMVGCALGVAILWLLVPAGGDAPVADVAGSARPPATATRPTEPAAADRSDGGVRSTTAAESTFAPPAPTTMQPASSAATGSGGIDTLPGEDPPANTVLMAHDDTPAVAVLLGDSALLVTTANAVGDLAEIEITFDSGGTATATVVSVGDSVAYLATSGTASDPVGFAQLAQPAPGDTVHALGDAVVSFAFGDPSALADAPEDALAEGTPVVDDRGALVGLCTHGDVGWDLVPVSAPPTPVADTSTTTTPSTSSAATSSVPGDDAEQPTAYLGVALGLDSAGHVAVLSVSPGSPADVAGIIAGQRILAVDGVRLSSPGELVAAVRSHRPGDAIELTVSTATAPVTASPRDTYAAASTTTVATTSTVGPVSTSTTVATSAGSTTGSALATTTLPPATSAGTAATTTTSTTSTTTASTTSTVATTPTTATTYDLPTYTVTVVLGERAPSV